MRVQPIILCGGSGTRLWPLSREHYPKQLLRLWGERSLLQATASRLAGLELDGWAVAAAPLLVGNEEYRFTMAQQLHELGITGCRSLVEPCGRNTAPALTLAALAAQAGGEDPVLVVMPADHVIQEEDAFRAAVARAVPVAGQGRVVTFGIRPTAPETGYGYIRQGAEMEDGVCLVEEFVEKPDLERAEAYLAGGQYLWNAGIFVIRASVWLERIGQFRPEIAAACGKAFDGRQEDRDFLWPDRAAFEACPADSIDYAVMEPLARGPGHSVAVLPLDARWSDVGAWNALWEICDKDGDRNVLLGDVVAVDTCNTLAMGQGRLVACVGLDNAVVVETPDAVLVADRNRIDQVREVVGRLKAMERSEPHSHRKVFRPWGWYDSIAAGPLFRLKHIVVNPGASLSRQMHHHRAEHWVVISGTARVSRGEETFLVAENQSTYIPQGVVHRLENPGKLPLEMIEVQSGNYLGEDDIVRFDDRYGR